MSVRREGWYWVKPKELNRWVCCEWIEGSSRFWCDDGKFHESTLLESPRYIPTPDEDWQCVPKDMTGPMYSALKNKDHGPGIDFECLLKWDAMLAAAPKPEDV